MVGETPRSRVAVFEHLRERAMERYGLIITRKKLTTVRSEIADGKWMTVAREADGVAHLVGKIDDVLVRIVWNPKTEVIRTFLPLDMRVTANRIAPIKRTPAGRGPR